MGEDSLAGNSDTVRLFGQRVLETYYHTLEHRLEVCIFGNGATVCETIQVHFEESDTVKWRKVMKCDECNSEVFRWSSHSETARMRVVSKSDTV